MFVIQKELNRGLNLKDMAYSQEQKDKILNSIFDYIEEGKSLRYALNQVGISSKTFYEWIDEDENKVKQYARATSVRTEMKFESIQDDYSEEPQRDPESGRIDSAWVQLQRLKIDAKKWELSKLNPKKYGDKLDLSSKDEKLQGVVINLGSGINPDETTN